VKLDDVIESLVEDRGLDREKVILALCEGIHAAYTKKYPNISFEVLFNKKTRETEVFVKKIVVSSVSDENTEILLKKALKLDSTVVEGSIVNVPFEEKIGRIEILIARQVIANRIRKIEQEAIYEEFAEKEGTIVNGTLHKKEKMGFVVQLGDNVAFLPNSAVIPGEVFRIGSPIRAYLAQVLNTPKGDYQLILDRASAEFVKKLFETEIPEIFEGIVEVKKIVRIPGYKTKIAVISNSSEIDPVGTCVGVDGVRIKPILRELSGEKIDVILFDNSLENFIKSSLKPAEIDKVEITGEDSAIVWLAQDQRSLAIGKMGRNILLASRITGININLQQVSSDVENKLSSDRDFDIESFEDIDRD